MKIWPTKEIKKQIDFDIVVHSWLKNEWDMPIFNDLRLNYQADLITYPNFKILSDNKARVDLLQSARGEIINSIPENTIWYEIEINSKDVNRIYHLPHPSWHEITNGTYRVEDGIKNIGAQNNQTVKIKEIITSLPENSRVNDLILIGSSLESAFTIIEGNHRFAAMVHKNGIDSKKWISELSYLGISQSMKESVFHIEKYF